MAYPAPNSTFRLNRPISKALKQKNRLKTITQKCQTSTVPSNIISTIQKISQMTSESMETAKFEEGVNLGLMSTLAKKQAQEVFLMVSGYQPSLRMAKKQTEITSDWLYSKESSLTSSVKENMGDSSCQNVWRRPQEAQAIFQ